MNPRKEIRYWLHRVGELVQITDPVLYDELVRISNHNHTNERQLRQAYARLQPYISKLKSS